MKLQALGMCNIDAKNKGAFDASHKITRGLDIARKIGSTAHANMRFGEAGRVLGTWTFQLWYDGRMMIEEKFNVVNP
jgi:hypothetical protein